MRPASDAPLGSGMLGGDGPSSMSAAADETVPSPDVFRGASGVLSLWVALDSAASSTSSWTAEAKSVATNLKFNSS